MRSYLSPKELAEVIDASESSIKRWVDKGILHAEKTEGGHRKISLDEAIRFIRESRSKIKRAGLLGFSDVDAVMDNAPVSPPDPNRFFDYLMAGDARKARGYLLYLYLLGYSTATIIDNVVQRAMEKVGELWTVEHKGICLEHHATDICIQAVNALRGLFHPPATSPILLGGALEDDPYMLPSLCVATMLLSEGYNAINLGPFTPTHSFQSAIDHYKPALVWISVSSITSARKTAAEIESMANYTHERNIRCAAGGRVIDSLRLSSDLNAYTGSSMAELTAYVKGLSLARG